MDVCILLPWFIRGAKVNSILKLAYRIYAHLTRGLNEFHEVQIRGKSKVRVNFKVNF